MIVGTAGHVDHGKSTLVRMLTGIDPDRWDEEKRRGLTIGLGFGFIELAGRAGAGGTRIGVIDVPGHRRFLPTMMRGAHAVDVALLVVAAHDGWMPQTAEHVAVLDAFGTSRGVVVITHVDRVSESRIRAVQEDLSRRLTGTFLEATTRAPRGVLRFDGTTGEGLEEIRCALEREAAAAEPPGRHGPVQHGDRPRLWVDRSFNIKGLGRVTTGTLTGGRLRVGDRVEWVRQGGAASPGSTPIASLHVDAVPSRSAGGGQRVGVRLADRSVSPEVGDALVASSQWAAGRHLHAAVRSLDPTGVLSQRGGYELVLGTGRWSVELRRSPKVTGELVPEPAGALPRSRPGEVPWEPVRLHARVQVGPVAPGDRFVLLDSSTSTAVAAGVLLSVDRRIIRRDRRSLQHRLSAVLAGDPEMLAAAMVNDHGPSLPLQEVVATLGAVPASMHGRPGGSLVFERSSVAAATEELAGSLEGTGGTVDGSTGVAVGDDPIVAFAARRLVASGRAVLHDGRLWRDENQRDAARDASSRVIARLAGERFWRRRDLLEAAVAEGLQAGVVADAIRAGALVVIPGGRTDPPASTGSRPAAQQAGSQRIISSRALERLTGVLIARLGESPAALGELRDTLGLSRNETLLLLEHLDARGITRREGDRRKLR